MDIQLEANGKKATYSGTQVDGRLLLDCKDGEHKGWPCLTRALTGAWWSVPPTHFLQLSDCSLS